MEEKQVLDATRINELWHEYGSAATAGDIERWIDLWIEDGIQLPPGEPQRVGKEQIQTGMQPLFDFFDTRMAVYPQEVQVLADQAYVRGSFEVVLTPKEGGDGKEAKGKFLTILSKQVDGIWKIAVDCFNYDAPVK